MVHCCCVKNCKRTFVKGGAVSFHKFPKNEFYRKEWEAQLRIENFIAKESDKICSRHFKEECFDRLKLGGTWLKKDAIPTIFNIPNSPKKQTLDKESVQQGEVKLSMVFPSSNILSAQNQMEMETFYCSSTASSVHNQVRVDTVPSISTVSTGLNQVEVERILPHSNFLSFQNPAIKVEEVSTSENECDSSTEKTIVASVSQKEGDAVKKREKRKYYLGDYDEIDMESPSKAKRFLAIAKLHDATSKKEIRNLRNKIKIKDQKIKSLKKILNELLSKRLLEDPTQKISKRVRGPSLCIEDMLEEIAIIINEPSPTFSD